MELPGEVVEHIRAMVRAVPSAMRALATGKNGGTHAIGDLDYYFDDGRCCLIGSEVVEVAMSYPEARHLAARGLDPVRDGRDYDGAEMLREALIAIDPLNGLLAEFQYDAIADVGSFITYEGEQYGQDAVRQAIYDAIESELSAAAAGR